MKYLSIDIETTGLDETWCQVLEVAAVLADTCDNVTPVDDLPSWTCRVIHDRIAGQPYALWLNADLIKDMEQSRKDVVFARDHRYMRPEDVFLEMSSWAKNLLGTDYKTVSPAGKNYGTFDSRFLWALPGWQREEFLKRRVMDPAMAFFDPVNDNTLPDLKTCIARAGLVDWDESKHHKAIEDAKVVITLLRAGDEFLRRRLCISTSSPVTTTSEPRPQDSTQPAGS